jgi:Ca2+-binding RTX toxin-like protein
LGDDSLVGNGGNDTLDGGMGADTMVGGFGSDLYIVDNPGDVVRETSTVATEIDTVQSSVSWALTVNLENLTLTASSAIDGFGNGLNNTLTGNNADNSLSGGAGNDSLNGGDGSDTLNGGIGNDTLTGGAGNDVFQLSNLSKDTITDFVEGEDSIQLTQTVFSKLTVGTLNAANFKILGSGATDANDYVLYDSNTGALFYDADGSGGVKAAVQIALLGTHLALTNADFVVI